MLMCVCLHVRHVPGRLLGGEVYSKEGTGEDDIKDMYERALAKQVR